MSVDQNLCVFPALLEVFGQIFPVDSVGVIRDAIFPDRLFDRLVCESLEMVDGFCGIAGNVFEHFAGNAIVDFKGRFVQGVVILPDALGEFQVLHSPLDSFAK